METDENPESLAPPALVPPPKPPRLPRPPPRPPRPPPAPIPPVVEISSSSPPVIPAPPPPSLSGRRQRARDNIWVENDYMATRALQEFIQGKIIKPIYTDYGTPIDPNTRILDSYYVPDCKVNERTQEWSYDTPIRHALGGIAFDADLARQARSDIIGERPLVFLITSEHHVTILIKTFGGDLYSCGYGYQGAVQDDTTQNFVVRSIEPFLEEKVNVVSSIHPEIERRLKPIKRIPHHFEILQGAIYTPDYLLPEPTQQSKISWIDFLDENMLNRIIRFLNRAKKIKYKGIIRSNFVNGEDVEEYLMNSTSIVVNEEYTESVSWLTFYKFFEKYNCLEWAKHILVATPQCPLNRPADCISISQDDFNQLYINLNNAPELVNVVKRIKRNLSNWCVETGCSISGGKTRKKNRKNNKKNNKKTYRGKKRKHKSRR